MAESGSDTDYFKIIKEFKKADWKCCKKAIRIALLTDFATQQFLQVLKVLFYRQSILAEIFNAEYNTIELEVFNPKSNLYKFQPEKIILLRSTQALRSQYYAVKDPRLFAQNTVESIESLWKAIRTQTTATILQNNFVMPFERFYGNFDSQIESSFTFQVSSINHQMREKVQCQSGVFVSDWEYLASYLGRKLWFDEKLWVLCKSPASFECLPWIAQNLVDTVLALEGRVVKCVVLDLDNILWGGVIGEDGLDGIRVGHLEDGEAFASFQQYLLQLKKRGIILAICSKNDLENAVLPFRKHPEMVLKEEDFSIFISNWDNKAKNIKQIREILNIGYDSMVFLDDQPFERNLVRQMLPQVIVPEIPEDPADIVKTLSELNLFETTTYSEEDSFRTKIYKHESLRKLDEKRFTDIGDYLRSLEMKIHASRFDAFNLPRIVQLILRSNQFNLTTQRYGKPECEAFMNDEKNFFPFYVRLIDKYGDSGVISIVILRFERETMFIDQWCMSCRVLSRGVEQWTMNFIFDLASERGCQKVVGKYIPTEKNQMVKNFYAQFGFSSRPGKGKEVEWRLDVKDYRIKDVAISKEVPTGV